jgi:hypothetical protein
LFSIPLPKVYQNPKKKVFLRTTIPHKGSYSNKYRLTDTRATNLPNLTNFSPKNLQSPIPNLVPKTLAPLKTPDKYECIRVSISGTVYCASNKIAPRTNNAKPLMEGLEASELGGSVVAVGPTLTVVAVIGWAPV